MDTSAGGPSPAAARTLHKPPCPPEGTPFSQSPDSVYCEGRRGQDKDDERDGNPAGGHFPATSCQCSGSPSTVLGEEAGTRGRVL